MKLNRSGLERFGRACVPGLFFLCGAWSLAAQSVSIEMVTPQSGERFNPHSNLFARAEELNLQVKERFDAEHIGFAFPSQTVYLKQDSEWRMSSGRQAALQSS
jgi:hypothetical protein